MAQTKRRRRRTKHRGNAAGMVEARGRTGRPPTAEERKAAKATSSRAHRLDTPPTWAAVAKRTLFIIGAFVVIFGFVAKPPVAGLILLAVFMFAVYVPLGYYT